MTGSAVPIHPRSSPSPILRLAGDARLLRLAAAGSEAAFATLYARHHQDLYRYCRTLVRHDDDAQDVLQTTMVRALAALQRGVPDAPARPWLFRIAHNEAVSLLRRRRPGEDLDAVVVTGGRALETTVDERARLRQLVADLADLPERQRGALVMRELSGLSHDEIAAALGVGVSGAKQAICDARVSLQEFEKGRAMQCAEVQRRISDGDGRALRGRPVRAHLRSCEPCRSMRDAIAARRAHLVALAPALPASTAMGVLAQVLGGGGAGGGAAAVGAAASKGVVGALVAKGVAGVAIVATAGLGAVEVSRPDRPDRPERRSASGAPARPAAGARVPAALAMPAGVRPAPRAASSAADVRRDRARRPEGRRPQDAADARRPRAGGRGRGQAPPAAGHDQPAGGRAAAGPAAPAATSRPPQHQGRAGNPARPARPVEPAKGRRSPHAATPARPATPAKPGGGATPATPATPAKPAKPAKPVQPAPAATPGDPAAPKGRKRRPELVDELTGRKSPK